MLSLLERMYSGSPVWAQQLGVASYGLWWYRRRFSRHFHELVAEFKSHEHWTPDQFRDYQKMRLDAVLKAARSSPHYRRIFEERGIGEGSPPFESLAQMPFLSKQTLRTRTEELLTANPPPKGTLAQETSGTTGTPVRAYYTRRLHALELAVSEARNLNWAGVDYTERRVMFGVRKVCRFDQTGPPFWRFSPVENMAYASVFHLSPRFLPVYMEFLREYKPTVIMGCPSALSTVAHYALETGDLPAPAKAAFTTSESVTDQAREAIEAAWRCRVYDRYGAVEGCLYASQCEHGSYHVSPEMGIIEILDGAGQPCPPGVMGEIVCTGLQNTLQPLIRYRIGDMARWSENQNCPCGRSLPILEAVEGRYEDICYTPDGRQMLRFGTVFKGVQNIWEAQVVQDSMDSFTIYVVPARGFSHYDIEKIKSNMCLHVGDVRTEVVIVPEIERATSGKFRSVVCNLSPEQKALLRKKLPVAGSFQLKGGRYEYAHNCDVYDIYDASAPRCAHAKA